MGQKAQAESAILTRLLNPICCVTVNKCPTLSESPFQLENGADDTDSAHFLRLSTKVRSIHSTDLLDAYLPGPCAVPGFGLGGRDPS